jgi:hypothetical protein
MALSRPLVPSTNDLLVFPSPLASIIANMSLFIYRKGNGMTYILLYVDNIIFIASSDVIRRSIMSLLPSEFAMKDLGALFWVLQLHIGHMAYFLCKLSISPGSPYKDLT